ncbi:MAG TPA: hypothetical protein VK111_14480 [Virgibacillus sp.]|nr:hypothetical protein [Virgibacillus sp.]
MPDWFFCGWNQFRDSTEAIFTEGHFLGDTIVEYLDVKRRKEAMDHRWCPAFNDLFLQMG